MVRLREKASCDGFPPMAKQDKVFSILQKISTQTTPNLNPPQTLRTILAILSFVSIEINRRQPSFFRWNFVVLFKIFLFIQPAFLAHVCFHMLSPGCRVLPREVKKYYIKSSVGSLFPLQNFDEKNNLNHKPYRKC